MKKIVLGLLSLFLVAGTVNAQTGKKALKKATKEISKYNSNPAENAEALASGLALLETAFEDAEVAADAKSYNMKGDIYNAIVEGEWKASLLGSGEITSVDAPFKSADAFVKAISMTDKKGDIKDAVQGLLGTEAHLNNVGVKFFEVQDYGTAFDYFNRAIEIYEAIEAAEGTSRLSDEAVRQEHFYVTAASGYYGDKKEEAKPIFMKMYEAGTDKALVYEALFKIGSDAKDPDAITYLEKGRELYPEDSGLLFAEINYYLQEGKLDDLTSKLKTAITQEPDNASLYSTLGNVYDQLNQQERAANNTAKADEYFALALDYYNQTLEKDQENFDAVYSQGALYYNKAAGMTGAINDLQNDFSPAGTKKYDALKSEMDGYFKQALPYFQKAEGLDPNDINTLVALREIYARADQLDKVGPLKARIEAIQAGN